MTTTVVRSYIVYKEPQIGMPHTPERLREYLSDLEFEIAQVLVVSVDPFAVPKRMRKAFFQVYALYPESFGRMHLIREEKYDTETAAVFHFDSVCHGEHT